MDASCLNPWHDSHQLGMRAKSRVMDVASSLSPQLYLPPLSPLPCYSCDAEVCCSPPARSPSVHPILCHAPIPLFLLSSAWRSSLPLFMCLFRCGRHHILAGWHSVAPFQHSSVGSDRVWVFLSGRGSSRVGVLRQFWPYSPGSRQLPADHLPWVVLCS